MKGSSKWYEWDWTARLVHVKVFTHGEKPCTSCTIKRGGMWSSVKISMSDMVKTHLDEIWRWETQLSLDISMVSHGHHSMHMIYSWDSGNLPCSKHRRQTLLKLRRSAPFLLSPSPSPCLIPLISDEWNKMWSSKLEAFEAKIQDLIQKTYRPIKTCYENRMPTKIKLEVWLRNGVWLLSFSIIYVYLVFPSCMLAYHRRSSFVP